MNRVSTNIVSVSVILIGLMLGAGQQRGILQAQPFTLNGQSEHPDDQEEMQIFSGTIVVMTSGIFVLKDDVKNISYGLDNQALASKFADKKVSVTGTLDKTDTIHIKNIEEQKA